MSWFYDKMGDIDGFRIGLKTGKRLYRKKNKFQEIQIFETADWGRALMLDKTIQATERDEFIYHEMISHVPLFLHENPKDVLIIGGGDGGVLKEVLKHKSIEKATLVEIDGDVVAASKKYLQGIHKNSFDDKRAEIIIDDGIKYIDACVNAFDVVIVDSSDPVGAAETLFTDNFYKSAKRALRSEGIFVTQSGSVFLQEEELKKTYKKISNFFPAAKLYVSIVPTYPSSLWSFTIASKFKNFDKARISVLDKRFRRIKKDMKFYNPEIHLAAFALPEFMNIKNKEH